MVTIREADRALARSDVLLDRDLTLTPRTSGDLLKAAAAEVGRRRIRMVVRTASVPLADRATTWGQRLIALPHDWAVRPVMSKAATLVHELRHVRQYAHHTAFRLRYLFSLRFRWAMEVQAYRDSIRAYKAMGESRDRLHDQARRIAGRMEESYELGRLEGVRAATLSLLMEVV